MRVIHTLRLTRILSLAALLFAGTAQAMPVTEVFDAAIDLGPAIGATGTLTIDYDSAQINGVGFEELRFGSFEVALDILGSVFNGRNDPSFPDFPRLGFMNGMIDTLDFVVANPIAGVASISGFLIEGGFYSMSSVEAVPAPGTALLACLGIGILLRRRLSA